MLHPAVLCVLYPVLPCCTLLYPACSTLLHPAVPYLLHPIPPCSTLLYPACCTLFYPAPPTCTLLYPAVPLCFRPCLGLPADPLRGHVHLDPADLRLQLHARQLRLPRDLLRSRVRDPPRRVEPRAGSRSHAHRKLNPRTPEAAQILDVKAPSGLLGVSSSILRNIQKF